MALGFSEGKAERQRDREKVRERRRMVLPACASTWTLTAAAVSIRHRSDAETCMVESKGEAAASGLVSACVLLDLLPAFYKKQSRLEFPEDLLIGFIMPTCEATGH